MYLPSLEAGFAFLPVACEVGQDSFLVLEAFQLKVFENLFLRRSQQPRSKHLILPFVVVLILGRVNSRCFQFQLASQAQLLYHDF